MSGPAPTPGVINGHTRESPYEYTPSAAANIAFLAIFAYRLSVFTLILGFSSVVTLSWELNIVHGFSVHYSFWVVWEKWWVISVALGPHMMLH
jgi:hypothetical protein